MKFNFFKGKKEKSNTDDVFSKERVDELEQYRKMISDVKSETTFLKSQFENYIYTSLVNDIELFKDALSKDKGLIDNSEEQPFWSVNDFSSSHFYLRKKAGNSFRDRLSVYVSFSFDDDKNIVDIKSVHGYGDIDSDRMKKVVSMYYYITQSHKLKQSSLSIKKDLEKVIKVVGRDTIRDGRIDEILGS